METIDFNQVIKDNISVVGELMMRDWISYTLDPEIETLVAAGSGMYYISSSDSLCATIVVSYENYDYVGVIPPSLVSIRVDKNKIYFTCTSSKPVNVKIRRLTRNY